MIIIFSIHSVPASLFYTLVMEMWPSTGRETCIRECAYAK